MKKVFGVLLLVVALAAMAFAGTPVGRAQIYLASGACPQALGNELGDQALDVTGQATFTNLFGALAPGQYCVTANFGGGTDGDGYNYQPSSGTQTETINSTDVNTSTSVVCPPTRQGVAVSCTVTVTVAP